MMIGNMKTRFDTPVNYVTHVVPFLLFVVIDDMGYDDL